MRKLYGYLGLESFLGLADGIFFYFLVSFLLDQEGSGSLIAYIVYFSAIVYILFSTFFSKKLDEYRIVTSLKVSLCLKFLGLANIPLVFYFASIDKPEHAIISYCSYKLIIVLDGTISQPLPFIICNKLKGDIIRYRVTMATLFRGTSMVTPGLALLAKESFGFYYSAILVTVLFGIGAMATFVILLGRIFEENEKLPSAQSAGNGVRPEENGANRIYLALYVAAIVTLNICFANSAVVMLAIASEGGFTSPWDTPHIYFFGGLTVASVILIAFEFPRKVIREGITLKIVLSTFFISITYIFFSFTKQNILLFVSGFVYSVNLQLVSTSLPSLLGTSKIFSNINYGSIANQIGLAISITWISILLNGNVPAMEIIAIMGFLGVLASFFLYILMKIVLHISNNGDLASKVRSI